MSQTELEQRADCPLCGSSTASVFLRGPDYFMHIPGTYQLVRCQECTLLFQNPRPPLHAIERYYPDHYGSYSSAQSGVVRQPWLLRMLIERAQGRRTRIIDHAVAAPADGSPRRLLDVGCASGLFLEMMQRRAGWQVEGVELNQAAAQATSARLGVPVFAGPVEHANFPSASFDAVTMWDVLEHLHDPLPLLREVRRILRPAGVLFVRVPNAASYIARLCGRYWSGYDLPRHMTLLSPQTLPLLLERAGFGAPELSFSSGSYIAALHSLRFALDASSLNPAAAARIHTALRHPALRIAAQLPLRVTDRLLGGSNLELLVRVRS